MAERARDPQELEREIERTRDELASTIDELVDRVNPKNVVQRGVTRLRDEAEKLVQAVNGPQDVPGGLRLPREIPPPVLIGAGVVLAATAIFLLRRRRR